MRASAEQVCWVPIEEIVETEEDVQEGEVILVCPQQDGRYALLGGGARLRRMRQAGQLCVDAVVAPREHMEDRLSGLLDQLVRGSIHYLDEAAAYRDLLDELLADRVEGAVWTEYYRGGKPSPAACPYRPWESAINLCGILAYLNAME